LDIYPANPHAQLAETTQGNLSKSSSGHLAKSSIAHIAATKWPGLVALVLRAAG
jgi:hypothetical protein